MIVLVSALGGLAFAFLGGTGAALALASRRGGVLVAVIVLPLIIPPVIFGGAAVSAFEAGLPWTTGAALLGAYALAAVGLDPLRHGGGLPQRSELTDVDRGGLQGVFTHLATPHRSLS